jgi:hypothetical protein
MSDFEPLRFDAETTLCPACGTRVFVPLRGNCFCSGCGEVFCSPKSQIAGTVKADDDVGDGCENVASRRTTGLQILPYPPVS